MNRTVQPDHRRHALKVCNRESTCLFSITSCELVFGRQINLPIDLQFGRFGEESGYRDKTEYVARENLKLGSERHKRYYDHKALHRGLKRGDAVWLHNPRRKKGRSPKLQRPWEGPYLVTSRLDDSIYRIQKGPRSKPVIVHVDRLKKYQGKRFINWLSEGKSGKMEYPLQVQFPLAIQPSSRAPSLRLQLRNLNGRRTMLRKYKEDHAGQQGDQPGQLIITWTKTLFILNSASDILVTLVQCSFFIRGDECVTCLLLHNYHAIER